MNKQQYIYYIKNYKSLNESDEPILKKLIEQFPYCQTTQLLYAKLLHNTNNIMFQEQLKKTAIYAIDRKTLYKLINSTDVSQNTTTTLQQENQINSIPSFQNELLTSTNDNIFITNNETDNLSTNITDEKPNIIESEKYNQSILPNNNQEPITNNINPSHSTNQNELITKLNDTEQKETSNNTIDNTLIINISHTQPDENQQQINSTKQIETEKPITSDYYQEKTITTQKTIIINKEIDEEKT
jgi:hypothetical protein